MPYIMWLDKDGRAIVCYHDGGSRIGSTFQERYENDKKEYYKPLAERQKEYEECLAKCEAYNLEHGYM